MAISGHNGNNETFIGASNLIGLSFYDLVNNNEIEITNSHIEIYIQRDSNLPKILFDYVNSTQIQFSPESLYLQNAFNITSSNASIHIELEPLNEKLGYILVIKLGSIPIINSTYSYYSAFKIFCPSNLDQFYKYRKTPNFGIWYYLCVFCKRSHEILKKIFRPTAKIFLNSSISWGLGTGAYFRMILTFRL
jgi:hypothetical protein